MNRFCRTRRNNKVGKRKNGIPQEILRKIFPRKLRSPRSFELVYGQLREMILKGKLRKGQRLFQEEIKRMFGVSVAVLSKVYGRLEKDKLIVKRGKTGTFVCDVRKRRRD